MRPCSYGITHTTKPNQSNLFQPESSKNTSQLILSLISLDSAKTDSFVEHEGRKVAVWVNLNF